MAEEVKKDGSFDWARFVEKVQQHLPKVGKDGEGNYGNYMKLEDLNPKLLKVLNDNGFAWVTLPSSIDGKPALRYMLVDTVNGGMIDDSMLLSLDKNSPQGQGSAITYARRYSLASVTGIVADLDDDGTEGSKPITDTSKSLQELETIIKATGSKDELNEVFSALTAPERKLAVPFVQEKLREVESA